jgi:copper transport protein
VTSALAANLILALALAAPAFAHAEPVRVTPEVNAALDRPPPQIELFFNLALEPAFSSIRVVDANGMQVDVGDSRVDPSDPTRLTVSLRAVPGGVYTAAWQALSAVDGHLTTGTFSFAVGEGAAIAEPAGHQTRLSLGEVLARWILHLSVAALTGGTLFVLVVWQPAYLTLKADAADVIGYRARWRWLAKVSLSLYFLALALDLLVRAGLAGGAEIAAPWHPSVGRLLFATRYGGLWSARLLLGLALAGLLPEARSRRSRWIALGASLALLLTISLTSHAASDPNPTLPVLSHWLHLLAASVWVGGLTHFVAGLWAVQDLPPQYRGRLSARLNKRFAVLVLLSVGFLLTGLYSAWARVGDFPALVTTLYGWALIAKSLVALLLIGLGGAAYLTPAPGSERTASQPTEDAPLAARVRGTIPPQAALGIVLLLGASVLASAPPAQTIPPPPSFSASTRVDDLTLMLDIVRGRVGNNSFHLNVAVNGQPAENVSGATLKFTSTAGGFPPSEVSLLQAGQGRYTIRGVYLNQPGTWQVRAVIRREGRPEAAANFDFELAAPTEPIEIPWHRVSSGALLLAAFACAASLVSLGRSQTYLTALGVVPAVALFLVGAFTFYRPIVVSTELTNPIPPSAASLARGQALYQEYCTPCHGPTGRGDGPIGLTLNPRPADLSIHTAPGLHSDGQLYLWITNGFPGSVMPAFGEPLTNEERWHLVNYIRTLAQP